MAIAMQMPKFLFRPSHATTPAKCTVTWQLLGPGYFLKVVQVESTLGNSTCQCWCKLQTV